MNDIIKKAIEGGWKSPYTWFENIIFPRFRGAGINTEMKIFYSYIVLDPLFWQALAKACGWKRRGIDKNTDSLIEKGMIVSYEDNTQEGWKYHALHFHEINLTKGWDKAVEYLSKLIATKIV